MYFFDFHQHRELPAGAPWENPHFGHLDHEGPNVNAPRTGAVLKRGDIFEASVVAPGRLPYTPVQEEGIYLSRLGDPPKPKIQQFFGGKSMILGSDDFETYPLSWISGGEILRSNDESPKTGS